MSYNFDQNEFVLKSAEGETEENIVTKALADLQKIVDDRLTAVETKAANIEAGKINARLDSLEIKLARPNVITGDHAGKVELKGLANFFRTGNAAEIETKTLNVGTASAGGVLAPPEYSSAVIQKIGETSPIRGLAQTVSMSGALLKIPRLVDEVDGIADVAELAAKPTDEPSFEQIDLQPFEMAVIVPVSKTLLEDATIDVNAFIANHLGTKFGQREAKLFISGNGTTQAEGVLTSTEVAAHEAALSADALIDVFYALKSGYSSRGAWLMNRATMAAVRKLKDSDGSYIWQSGLQSGQPSLLLGRPVYEAVDMPNPTVGNTPIVFGDFGSGYLIADRVNLELQVDAVTGFSTGLVKIGARRRVGGRVILGEALTKLKISA